jgi:xanthine dehydrogenase accessory factor
MAVTFATDGAEASSRGWPHPDRAHSGQGIGDTGVTEVLEQAERWVAAAKRVALATVISTEGSAPRDPGAMLAVNDDGEIAGSVSVGCVEAAVVTEALAVLEAGRPARLKFGFEEETEFAVGLTCGGRIEVFVERLNW